MKTTIELPEDLFQAAKLTAAKRRITLKTLFTQALRKEVNPPACKPSGLIWSLAIFTYVNKNLFAN